MVLPPVIQLEILNCLQDEWHLKHIFENLVHLSTFQILPK